MLLTVQGYFEAGQFIADTPITIPERRKTIVTVLDEQAPHVRDLAVHKKRWREIIQDVRNCVEVLEGEPERISFKTAEEIDAL
jgi:uncharacterized protein (UPF0216 family)